MVFKHEDWTLYTIEPEFKTIGKRKMYFFSKKIPKRGIPCDMPDGYEIVVNEKTGLPFLRYSDKLSLYRKNKLAK